MEKTTLADIADYLEDRDDFAVYYHINPDGDAVGSAFALVMALKAMKKNACAVCADSIPANYHFLTDNTGNSPFAARVNIAVDTAAPSRLGEYGDLKFSVVIDHHEVNSIEAKLKYIRPEVSSCAEIVYELIREIGVPISSLMADLLFTGIITDTCCFRSRSTNAGTFRAAYELAALGADCVKLTRRFCYEKDEKRLAIEKRLSERMIFRADGQAAATMLTHSDFVDMSITPEDLEGINETIDCIQGLKIGLLIRERKEGKVRVSVRTAGKLNAAEFCALHGGGGHRYSGGIQTEGKAEDIIEKLLLSAEEYLRSKCSL